MTNWKEHLLGDVIDIIGGGTPKTSVPEYWDGDIPWLSVVDFNNDLKYVKTTEKTITQKGLDSSSTKILNPGDVIISARGTVGAIAVVTIPMAFNQSCYGIRPKFNDLTSDFLYYTLINCLNEFKQVSYGSVFDTITRDSFQEIQISLPPLPEQKAIASVLSCLDDKIDLLHRQNKTLEAMAEALFKQWFVVEAKDDWEEKEIGDVVSVFGGSTPSTKNQLYWNGNINWITPRDLSGNQNIFTINTNRYISEHGLSLISSGILPLGTVLLSSRAPIGYLSITALPLAINQGFIAIVCDKSISNYFIFLWCKYFLDDIKNISNGSTFQEVSKSNFKKMPILIPDKGTMVSFNSLINTIFSKIKFNIFQIDLLQNLRDKLSPYLLNGDVQIII